MICFTFKFSNNKKLYTLKPLHLNNTAKAEKEWIFFNRLEKVGSQSMIVFLEALADANNFVAHIMKQNAYVRLTYTEEEEKAMAEDLDDVEEVMSYTEHTNWINFTKYDLPKPIYINLVRHPLRKTMSAYYYNRRPEVYEYYKKKYNRTMSAKEIRMSFNDCVKEGKRPECKFDSKNPFNADWRRAALHFCGNKNVCKQFNSQTATQIAKRNIEQDYAVVGTWEETNITLSVLEHYIPRFFKDATKIFYSDVNRFRKNVTPHKSELEPEVEAKLKIQFAFEIELYNFCMQRLYKQYIAIKKDEMMKKFEKMPIYVSFITEEEEQAIAEELDEVNEPMSYSEHTNWINFTQFDLPKPIYINLIRYPINRIMSAYYFKRRPDVYEFYKKKFNRTDYDESYFKTSFNDCVKQAKREECKFEADSRYNADWRKAAIHFCGNKPVCRHFNSPAATQIAKHNIEQDYAVVGSWEDTNITLTVLEHYIPRFFKDATKIFYSDSNKFHKNATPHKSELEPAVEAKLKRQFSYEIELYNFCKQRLYKQYIAIKKDELMKEFE
ncbi:heparan sulfate 2-O-sulfotransferase pipe-like, partial [Lucilia sericata]|uniref:heparan sulfate 2-O-sulfotransferase pipe-like n=1 Tax=Lucilia sericata TaxID=13632 RepID=UPI0018A830C2